MDLRRLIPTVLVGPFVLLAGCGGVSDSALLINATTVVQVNTVTVAGTTVSIAAPQETVPTTVAEPILTKGERAAKAKAEKKAAAKKKAETKARAAQAKKEARAVAAGEARQRRQRQAAAAAEAAAETARQKKREEVRAANRSSYPPGVRESFVESCTGDEQEKVVYCACVFRYLSFAISYTKMSEFDEALLDGRASVDDLPIFQKAAASCA
jgi:hypothetical protein